MSRKPYKFTAPRRALVLQAIAEGKTRTAAMESVGLDPKVDIHVGAEQALAAKIMGMAQLGEPEEHDGSD